MGVVVLTMSLGVVLVPGALPSPTADESFDLETAQSDPTGDEGAMFASDAPGVGDRLQLPPSISAADSLSVTSAEESVLSHLVRREDPEADQSVIAVVNRLGANPGTTTTTRREEPTIEPEGEWVDAGHGVAVPDVLLRIRYCESTNNYRAANRVSSARGAYQFLTGSWASYGHAARYGVATADQATPAQQDEAAVITLRRSGTRPWYASRHCWQSESINPNYATIRPATTTTGVTTTSTTAPEPVSTDQTSTSGASTTTTASPTTPSTTAPTNGSSSTESSVSTSSTTTSTSTPSTTSSSTTSSTTTSTTTG